MSARGGFISPIAFYTRIKSLKKFCRRFCLSTHSHALEIDLNLTLSRFPGRFSNRMEKRHPIKNPSSSRNTSDLVGRGVGRAAAPAGVMTRWTIQLTHISRHKCCDIVVAGLTDYEEKINKDEGPFSPSLLTRALWPRANRSTSSVCMISSSQQIPSAGVEGPPRRRHHKMHTQMLSVLMVLCWTLVVAGPGLAAPSGEAGGRKVARWLDPAWLMGDSGPERSGRRPQAPPPVCSSDNNPAPTSAPSFSSTGAGSRTATRSKTPTSSASSSPPAPTLPSLPSASSSTPSFPPPPPLLNSPINFLPIPANSPTPPPLDLSLVSVPVSISSGRTPRRMPFLTHLSPRPPISLTFSPNWILSPEPHLMWYRQQPSHPTNFLSSSAATNNHSIQSIMYPSVEVDPNDPLPWRIMLLMNPQPSTTHMRYNIETRKSLVRGAVMRMIINSGMHFKRHSVRVGACVCYVEAQTRWGFREYKV
ncbi:hypothetical protein VP01_2230g1 [Puccinia sorghi]|uniref:Uncharacterized protein n=1 Tax=Puccinia sorghi TaxID=27349 RepID=A0A0L6VAI9_9BASI|nr:hypothetical protein VP01_2230g1 [Puccinia sorghi]